MNCIVINQNAKRELGAIRGSCRGEMMKLNDQVVSLELAKKMKELGIEKNSLWSWVVGDKDKATGIILAPKKDTMLHLENPIDDAVYIQGIGEHYSAYTVAELGEMLPEYVTSEKCNFKKGFFVRAEEETYNTLEITEADARAKMLIWLKENNYL